MDDRDLVETVPLPNRKRDTLDSLSGLTKQNNKKEALSLPQNDPLHENDVGIEGLHILKRSHDGSGPLRLRK